MGYYYIGVDNKPEEEALEVAVQIVRDGGDNTEILDGPTVYAVVEIENGTRVVVYLETALVDEVPPSTGT